MKDMVTALEPNGQKTPKSAVVPPPGEMSGPPSHQAAKFIYPGGSRPLDGYTIKRGVGQGGFGEIYYALSDAGKEVALKLIRRNLDVELRGIRQCLNIKHPNLIDLYDIRQDAQGDTWVVMEYVSGLCLQDAVDNNPHGMPVDDVLAWIHGIGAAVAYLHDHGIVHRDLKPGNVFSNEGVVKVGDYGLSKFISCSRRSGHTESIGTVHYMAPEVANGRYGKEIDVYALGIILYEMLTGRVPFEGESVGEVLMKHLTAKPDVSMLAEPYRDVVAKALEKDPDRRYRSAAEMLAALPQPKQTFPGDGRLPSGRPYTGDIPPEKGSKRHLAETIVLAQTADDEPVLRTIKQNWAKIRKTWDDANLPPIAKIALLIAGVLVFISSLGALLPVAISLFITYGVYRVVRVIVLAWQGPRPESVRYPVSPAAPQASPPLADSPGTSPASVQEQRRRELKAARRRFEKAVPALVLGTPRERVAELLGSLLLSSLVAVAMMVIMVLVSGYFNNTIPKPEQCAWLLLTTIAGAWTVLIPAKFWEGTHGDAALRRFVMMVLGFGLGELAYYVSMLFMVDLPPSQHGIYTSVHFNLPRSFYSDGRPMLMAYLAVFGALFFIIRWWRQADPLRSKRLRIWSLLITVAVAGIISSMLEFPQLWLPMVAGAISVTVQLSSPWAYPGKLKRKT
ncbi:MAG: serine/threonine-protein kinase [Thermoguttaceae bacterium]|jgi:serine/threonine protein kinase